MAICKMVFSKRLLRKDHFAIYMICFLSNFGFTGVSIGIMRIIIVADFNTGA